jgi:hypothetical protein
MRSNAKSLAAVLISVGLGVAAIAADKPAPAPAPATFDKVKALAGDWTAKDDDGKPVDLNFNITSGGTAVLETVTMGAHGPMVSVYHADGEAVMLTHYCAMGNQPRLRAKGGDKELAFAFVDATNLPSPTSPHMHSMKLTIEDKDHITEEWMMSGGGKESPHAFHFTRKS